MLEKSKDSLGYTTEELLAICKKRKISWKNFSEAFGVNTCVMGKDGKARFYRVDVERALAILGHKDGIAHVWD
jgi:hypothetical protein